MSDATAARQQPDLSPLERLSVEHALPTLLLDDFTPQPEATKLVSYALAVKLRIVPLSRVGCVVTIVTADPCNVVAIDHVRAVTGLRVEVCVTTEESILSNLCRFYNVPADTLDEEVHYSEAQAAKFTEKSSLFISSALTSHTVKHVRRRADGHHAWNIEVPTESASELIDQALRHLEQR